MEENERIDINVEKHALASAFCNTQQTNKRTHTLANIQIHRATFIKTAVRQYVCAVRKFVLMCV